MPLKQFSQCPHCVHKTELYKITLNSYSLCTKTERTVTLNQAPNDHSMWSTKAELYKITLNDHLLCTERYKITSTITHCVPRRSTVQYNPERPRTVNQGETVQDDLELTSTGGPKQDISTWRSSSRCLYLGSPELSSISSWQIIN